MPKMKREQLQHLIKLKYLKLIELGIQILEVTPTSSSHHIKKISTSDLRY